MLSIITPTTHDREASFQFYRSLNFHKIGSDESRAFFTDGQAMIEIASDRIIRPGLVLAMDDFDMLSDLELQPIEMADSQEKLLQSPGGIWIYLRASHSFPIIPDTIAPSICGKYAGVSIEVGHMKKEVAFWQLLGFEPSMGGLTQGWITLKNKAKDTISIMKPLVCPHLFYNPSLTYFNGTNNLKCIADIRQSGLAIHEEITHFNPEGKVDNIVLRDPGGIGFFIFSD